MSLPVRTLIVALAIAASAVACVGAEELPDVRRSDASADRVDGVASDVPNAVGMDAVDVPSVRMDVPNAIDVIASDGPTVDVACRVMCGANCTDTQVDPRNCGACFRDCANLPGVDPSLARCMAGFCQVGMACLPNRADCDRDASNGCETDLGTAANCGACGTMCAEPNPICTMQPADGGVARFRCGTGCVAPTPDRCLMVCVDLQSSPRNCGLCGSVCPAAANATAACNAGRCGLSCNAGFGDCDGNAVNGCETNTRTSAVHCGMCGNVCPGVVGASPACNNGVCGIACVAPQGDCDGNVMNGCETDTRTSVTNCGACGRSCAPGANATPTCMASACGLACNMGFANCNASLVDGCEIDTTSNRSHCGGCGRVCAAVANATPTCTMSSCGATCNAGFGNCDNNIVNGCEINLNTSPLNCGACGTVCPIPANGTATCALGVCGASCSAGFGNCDGNIANGCEVDTNNSNSHCGGCGMVCAAPANATTQCGAGRCVITCDNGFTLSGAVCVRTPPKLVSPWLGATVTTRRPNFSVILPLGQDGIEVELCADRACLAVDTRFTAIGSSGGLPMPVMLTNRMYYWRARGTVGGGIATGYSEVYQFVSSSGTSVGQGGMWGTTLNPNGDNFADLLSGSPSSSNAQYRATGAAVTTQTLTGGSGFGTSVASAGDVNGDGYSDAIIGAPTAAGGVVNVFLSNRSTFTVPATVVLNAPAGVAQYGRIVMGLGDVNSDGYADVAIAATGRLYIHHGTATGLNPVPSRTYTSAMGQYATSIAHACDVNADGYGDVIVGSDGAPNSIYVYYGGVFGADMNGFTIAGPMGSTGFGRSVDCAGDVNGDGSVDIIVGAYGNSRAYVYQGSVLGLNSVPVSTLGAVPAVANLGFIVGAAGDFDRDGYADVLAGAPSNGGLVLYWGRPVNPTDLEAQSFAVNIATFGTSVTAADFENDLFTDIVVGHPSANQTRTYRGRAGHAALPVAVTVAGVAGTGNSVAAQ